MDAESMQEVAANYSALGVQTVHGSVRHILARKVKLGTFDFVYAAGFYDYLPDNVAQALTARMFEMTSPGGQMLIPNFAPQVDDRAYMETFMDSHLIYRDEYDMGMLVAGIDPAQIESYDLYRPGGFGGLPASEKSGRCPRTTMERPSAQSPFAQRRFPNVSPDDWPPAMRSPARSVARPPPESGNVDTGSYWQC